MDTRHHQSFLSESELVNVSFSCAATLCMMFPLSGPELADICCWRGGRHVMEDTETSCERGIKCTTAAIPARCDLWAATLLSIKKHMKRVVEVQHVVKTNVVEGGLLTTLVTPAIIGEKLDKRNKPVDSPPPTKF